MSVGLAGCAHLLRALWLGQGRGARWWWWLMPAVPLRRAGKVWRQKSGSQSSRVGRGGSDGAAWHRDPWQPLLWVPAGAKSWCWVRRRSCRGAPCFVCVCFSSHTHEGSVWWRGQKAARLSSLSSQEPPRASGDAPVLSQRQAELQTRSPCCSSPKASGFEALSPFKQCGFWVPPPSPSLSFFLCCRLVSHRHCRKAAAFSQSTVIGLACFFSEQRGCFGGAFPTLSQACACTEGRG